MKLIKLEDVKYDIVKEPKIDLPTYYPEISKNTYKERQEKILKGMVNKDIDHLFVYADREDYGNFKYLANFEPRFEEALLYMNRSGDVKLILGNENLGMEEYSGVPAEGIHYPTFSLPNQPMFENRDFSAILTEDLKINEKDKVGLAGWKLIQSNYKGRDMFDAPSFVVDPIRDLIGANNLINVTDIFIDPEIGARATNNANEIARYEFGGAYASDAVQNMLLNARTGLTEIEISQFHTAGSLPTNLFPKVLAGDRIDINMTSCTTNVAELGDRFQVSMGLIGGQVNRRGYLAYDENDLPEESRDWFEKHAKPYFMACANWYEKIDIGMTGGELYDFIEEIYPQDKYGWFLNPGHLIAEEEWMSTPVFKDSDITLKNGMIFQMDILVSVDKKYAGPDFEDGVVLADDKLQSQLKEEYPDVYNRMIERREYMRKELGINISDNVLPMSTLAGLYRPYMLNKDKAFKVVR